MILAVQTFSVYSQTYPVQIQPTISFPSTFLSDYNDPSNLNVRVFLSDITKTDYRIRLKVRLTSEKLSAISTTGIELVLQGGQVYFLSDTELGDLFTPSNLSINTNVPTNTDNSLPEGVYTMAFEAFDATVPGNIVVSNAATDFTVFSVNRYDPPMLTSPANKESFDVMTINQNIFFTWTPRHIVFSPKQQVKYRFRLIKVQPVDRNPYDAMNVTLPAVIDQEGLDFPVFVYTPADLPLEEGCVYAWQVIAYEEVMVGAQMQSSSARFKNLGQSEVFTFSIKENCQPVTPIKAPVVSKNLVALQWNYDPSHKEYEIAYRPFATSLPWTPVSTVDNLYNLDNTVLQAGVTYEYTIKAKCKNWTDAVYGGTFTMAVPTCSAPAPVAVDNSETDKTILTWPVVNGATAYRFQYKNSSSPSAAYTSVDLLSSDQRYELPKLTSGGYIIKVDGVCDAETVEGSPNTIAFDETGVVGPCPIPTPFQLLATRIKSDTAQLSWPVSTAHTGYSITYWHRDSSAVKRTITSTDPRVIAGYIYDDQLYYYQITFLCGTKSTTTPPGMFRVEGNAGGVVTDPTTANCFPPAVLQAEPRSTTSALFDWSKVDGVDEYQLFYSVKGANQFKPFNTISNSAQIKDLIDSEKYQYMVRSRCGGQYSIFSDTALVDLAGGRTNANCDSAAYFITKGQTTTDIRLCWPNKAADTGYKLTYREEAQSPADEYTQTFADMVAFKRDHLLNDTLRYTFDNLKSGTAYIFKLQVLCGTDEALRNAPLKVSTVADAKSTGECGRTQSCDKTNVTPLASLAPGDSIHCADYGILVDKITASNPATGTYTGSGFMNMPFPGLSDFVRMSVSFKNVKINAKPNSCIYDGTINIDSVNASAMPLELRDKIKAAEEQISATIDQAQTAITAAQEGIDQAQEALQTAVDYFQGGDNVGGVVDGGLGETTTTQVITATTAPVSGGQATLGGKTFAVPGLIKDNNGDVFQVSPTGAVTHVGKYDPALASNPTLDLEDGKIVYTEFIPSKYDFDEWKSTYAGKIQVEREYEKIGIDYYVPAKLILPGELDKVNASIVGGSYDKTKIKFANGKGMVYDHSLSGSTFTINIAGGPAADGQYIYAWFVDGETKKAIGKLLVPSYAPQQKEVVIITVGKSVIDAAKYQKGLNDVYGKIGITYTVTVDDSFKNNKTWDGDGDGKVQAAGSKLLSTEYKGEEAAMILAYADSKGGEDKLDPSTAYILAVYEAANLEDNLLGKMPAEEQFGFIYVGGAQETSLVRTVAHELGHGAYHMEHSFHNIYLGSDSKTKTTNIMDYGTGLDLWKYQWDIVHDPGHVWGVLKRDKDAQNLQVHYNLLDPAGRVFSTDGNPIDILAAIEYGPVLEFTYFKTSTSTDIYTARYDASGKFTGYKSKDGNRPFKQEFTDDLSLGIDVRIHVVVKKGDHYAWKFLETKVHDDPLSDFSTLVCSDCSTNELNNSPQVGVFSKDATLYNSAGVLFMWDYSNLKEESFKELIGEVTFTDKTNITYTDFTYGAKTVHLIKSSETVYDFSAYRYPSIVSNPVINTELTAFKQKGNPNSNLCIVTKDNEIIQYNTSTQSYTARTFTPFDRLPSQSQLNKNKGVLMVQKPDYSYDIKVSDKFKQDFANQYFKEDEDALTKVGNFFVAYGQGLVFAGNQYHEAWVELAELLETSTDTYVNVGLADYKCTTIDKYKDDHYTKYMIFVLSSKVGNDNPPDLPDNVYCADAMGKWNSIISIPSELVSGVAAVSSVFSSEQWSKGKKWTVDYLNSDDKVDAVVEWSSNMYTGIKTKLADADACQLAYYKGQVVGIVVTAVVAPEGLPDMLVGLSFKAAAKFASLTKKVVGNVITFSKGALDVLKISERYAKFKWKRKKGDVAIEVQIDETTSNNNDLIEELSNDIESDKIEVDDDGSLIIEDNVNADDDLADQLDDLPPVRDPNWVEVLDIRTKINAKVGHVIEDLELNAAGTGFSGCHSEISLKKYVAANPNSRYVVQNVTYDMNSGIDDLSRVYEGNPVVVKPDGTQLVKTNNGGVSSFFPKNWDKDRILDEVEHAISNNHGKIPSKPNGNEYYGFSIDGKVEIHFYYNTSDGSIRSFFPKKN
ncbi:MAG: hypothetical protein K0R51_1084 [Cytophagaceae bacterium]|nr:hypothetical protein [Cytophagaceae bacterium]